MRFARALLYVPIIVPEHTGRIDAALDSSGSLDITQEYSRQPVGSKRLLFLGPNSKGGVMYSQPAARSDVTANTRDDIFTASYGTCRLITMFTPELH
jgi:hypothetical protein